MLEAKELHALHFCVDLLQDKKFIEKMRANIQQGDAYIIKNMLDTQYLPIIKNYLIAIGRHSLPTYQPIVAGAPNSHRVNRLDDRAYVKGCFHQFVFYPWNQDVFDFFNLMRPIFYLKNLISGLPKEAFLGHAPEQDCIARLAFQFYPIGGGYLNKHTDPVDYHQLTVPVMLLSEKGVDFSEGGGYMMNQKQEMIPMDAAMQLGDVIFFNAQVLHGVAPIDPDQPLNWLDFRGRWIALFSVNKLATNTTIAASVEYPS